MLGLFFWGVRDKDVLDGTMLGDVVVLLSGLTGAAMVVAWWFRSQQLVEAALLAAGAVWLTRGLMSGFLTGWDTITVWLSLVCWTTLAWGSYLLEHVDRPIKG